MPLTLLGDFSLENNRSITSVAPLAELTQLTKLNLWGNKIGDLGPLRDLRELRTLIISDNPITSLEPLSVVDSIGGVAGQL